MENEDALFRELCENAHDLIQCVAPDGRYLYVNRAWLRTLGYDRKEVAGLTFFDIVHPDSREHCEKVLDDLLAGGDAVDIEADFRAKDGRRVSVEGSASCLRDGDELVSTQGIFHDVTARHQTQQELDRLFELSLDMLCVAGTDGYFKQINPAFERVLGYSREELLSREFLEFVHPDDRAGTVAEVEHLARGEPTVDFRNRYLAADGGYRWLAWRATPLPERGLIYATARDITDERRTQELLRKQTEELARSNADLERFAYVASHDLRSPLRTLRTLADWVRDELPPETPAKARKDLVRLGERAERLETLVDDLLRYARARRGERDVRSVDTARLVGELAELLAPTAQWQITAAPGLPTIETDRAALEQVLRNLIDNAIKHHDRDRGRIVVSARERGDRIEFVVADDGPGLPDGSTEPDARRSAGAGMGVATVRRLVDAHGGEVRFESRGPRGLAVRFDWPRRIATESTPAPTPEAE